MPDDAPAELKHFDKSDGGPDDVADNYTAYLEYNRVLRTWFVAFGVGGPALFLVNEEIATRLHKAGELRLVAGLFIAGAALQVLGALINKVANWHVYKSANDWWCRASERVIGWFWIDKVFDVLTIGVFGWAAWLLLTVFGGDGQPPQPPCTSP